MSTPERDGEDTLTRFESDLEARVDALFRKYPALRGFSLQTREALGAGRNARALDEALSLADLVIDGWPTVKLSHALEESIAETLRPLISERGDATELLRGRTFARFLN